MNRSGFTLIEVLIVLMILAVITTLTATTIQNSIQNKSKIQKNLDQSAALRNAISVIERDISLSFNYRDPNLKIEEAIRKQKLKLQQELAAQGKLTPDAQTVDDQPRPEPKKLTQFQGESNKLAFTSLSGVRITPDGRESDQVEVSYETRSCKSPFDPKRNMTCLFRRTSYEVDDKLDAGGESVAILEGVTDFKLRYFGEGKSDWVDTGKTGEGADDTTRNHFPQAVEISLETEENEKKYKLVSVAELRFPNNEKKQTNEEPSDAAGTSR